MYKRQDADTAKAITKKAKPQYREIIRRLPEFEKADRFKMNIVNPFHPDLLPDYKPTYYERLN